MLNLWKRRRRKWLYPRIRISDLQRKIHYIEFENKYILEFVRKYLVLNRENNNHLYDSEIDENHDSSIYIFNQFLGNHQSTFKIHKIL
jgi:hypothetical protein